VTSAVALVLAALGVVFLVAGIGAIRRRRPLRVALRWSAGLVFLLAAGLCAALGVATQGYRALTREEVAAVVAVAPAGTQRFDAVFRFPDGRETRYRLAGDALYVDAHILKWRPIANLMGLHTAYELDRVAGRYADLEDERTRPRSVFSLAAERRVDLLDLGRRFPLLRLLVDAEYGSATFIVADRPARFEVRVSTTGLLIRPVREPEALTRFPQPRS
jgi:hypothetical protein